MPHGLAPPVVAGAAVSIHAAECATDGTGAVEFDAAGLTEAQAVNLRKRSLDIVVCGTDRKANRRQAQTVEAQVGPYNFHLSHARAGRYALPHFHQQDRPPGPGPDGHCFYEVDGKKARKKKP
jgi:hypothetical protein